MNMNRAFVGLIIAIGCSGTATAQVGNTKYGTNALMSNATGNDNSAFGMNALGDNTSGNSNTAIGFQSLLHNNGSSNSAMGYQSMSFNTVGINNTAQGFHALNQNTTGLDNTALGGDALPANISGRFNTAVGAGALFTNASGSNNIGIGFEAGKFTKTGNNNIEIGNAGLSTDNKVIRIGIQGTQRFTQIAGIYDSKVIGGRAVVVDSKGQLGYAVTKVVPNVAGPATTADILSLRQEIAQLRTQLNVLKAQMVKVH